MWLQALRLQTLSLADKAEAHFFFLINFFNWHKAAKNFKINHYLNHNIKRKTQSLKVLKTKERGRRRHLRIHIYSKNVFKFFTSIKKKLNIAVSSVRWSSIYFLLVVEKN